ncbi:hypothetical protein HW555_010980 [Spodoptera exigua]|uniref:DUF7041 domain-containing protein n=1 Tax=Spodoptera exigua TaxID=7107 RepID=A0A835L216_SPOEX|nr:hypothetical protein HW555_013572 [Spodoptera exigua]KAF9409690.1 hypothetical protein HW555_010980 [Spodoptera exigua]
MMQPQVPAHPTVKSEDKVSDLAQITIKTQIPDFWTDQPRLWFGQFEVIVADQKLGEKKKFNLVVAKLSKENVQQVSDLILEPPEDKQYTALKERLLNIYEESDTQRIRKLLKEIDLGDQKPSQLLRKMKDLGRGRFPDDTLRILWIGHLPAAVRTVLTISEVTDLTKLAEQADKIMETAEPTEAISEVASSSSTSSTDALVAEISKLSKRIDDMHRQNWKKSDSRSRSPSPRRRYIPSQQRNRKRSTDWVCFYHFRFGRKATRCEQPCSWKSGAALSGKRQTGN